MPKFFVEIYSIEMYGPFTAKSKEELKFKLDNGELDLDEKYYDKVSGVELQIVKK